MGPPVSVGLSLAAEREANSAWLSSKVRILPLKAPALVAQELWVTSAWAWQSARMNWTRSGGQSGSSGT